MADLASILTALALSSGLHAYGHQSVGNEVNVPVDINWRNRTESYNSPINWKEGQIHGGGFSSQDRLASALKGTDAEQSMKIANALYKLGYMSGLTLPSGTQGDIKNLEQTSGNKLTGPLLGATIATDLLGAYNPNRRWDLNFVAPEGRPGLMLNWKW